MRVKIAVSEPERFDKLVHAAFPRFSRRRIRLLIEQGSVYLNNRRLQRQSFRVKPAQEIRLELHDFDGSPLDHLAAEIDWRERIVSRDAHLVAVNKPAGIPSAPTRESARHNILWYLAQEQLLPPSHYPLHRLDSGTSGLLLLPLTRASAAFLNREMQRHQIGKRYLAIAHGTPPDSEWSIGGFLGPYRGKNSPVVFSPQKRRGFRASKTVFRILAQDCGASLSLLEAIPETGRTHQIRAHLKASGMAILGDDIYGNGQDRVFYARRLALHCRQMSFVHPHFKDRTELSAPIPEYLESFIHEHLPVSKY